jgi:hypothetical protein
MIMDYNPVNIRIERKCVGLLGLHKHDDYIFSRL